MVPADHALPYYLIGRDGKLASRHLEGGADEILAWAGRLAAHPSNARVSHYSERREFAGSMRSARRADGRIAITTTMPSVANAVA